MTAEKYNIASHHAREAAEDFHPKDAGASKHGDAAVLKLSFAEPVQVNAHVVDVGQAQRIEAYVTRHRAVQLMSCEGIERKWVITHAEE